MLRNYIVNSASVTIRFPEAAYEHFLPGIEIDVIDLGILNHIYRLPMFLSESCDGPSQLIFEQVTTDEYENKLFFEFALREFYNCYPLFDIKTELNILDRLNRLVENGLLVSVPSKEFKNVTLYRTTELYEELFVC